MQNPSQEVEVEKIEVKRIFLVTSNSLAQLSDDAHTEIPNSFRDRVSEGKQYLPGFRNPQGDNQFCLAEVLGVAYEDGSCRTLSPEFKEIGIATSDSDLMKEPTALFNGRWKIVEGEYSGEYLPNKGMNQLFGVSILQVIEGAGKDRTLDLKNWSSILRNCNVRLRIYSGWLTSDTTGRCHVEDWTFHYSALRISGVGKSQTLDMRLDLERTIESARSRGEIKTLVESQTELQKLLKPGPKSVEDRNHNGKEDR